MKKTSSLKPLKHPLVLSLIGVLVLTVCVQGAFLIKFASEGLNTNKLAQKVTQLVDESWFETTPSFMSDTTLNEDDLAYHVTMSIPGILEDNFDVSIENRTITVQGKREVFNEKDKGTGKFLMRSQSQNSFRKSYTLPGTNPLENFQTEYENGLLKITIFKCPTNK